MTAAPRSRPLRRRWAGLPLRTKGLVILAVPTALVVAAVVALVLTTAAQSRSQARTRSAAATAAAAQSTLVELLNAETGVRGYVASGDPVLLAPWRWALTDLGGAVSRLGARPDLAAGVPATIRSLVSGEMSLLRALVATSAGADTGADAGPGARSPAAQRAITARLLAGKALMDRLRRLTGSIAAASQRVIAHERARVTSLRRLGTAVAIAGLMFGMLGLLALYLFLRRVADAINQVRADARRLGLGERLGPASTADDELGRLSRELAQASKLLSSRSLDLVRAHQAAIDAGQEHARLLARIGHELRTPLTAILGFGQLLRDGGELSDDRLEYSEHVVHAGRHAVALLDEIDDPGRAERVLTLDVAATEIAPLARDVCGLMAPLAAEREITFAIDLPDGVSVLADRQRLEEVLINLFSNAIKYNRVGGTVTVFADLSVTGLRVWVVDSGPGIRPDLLPRVFAPFERLDAAHGPMPGAGVGLAVCRTYIEAMGGAIGIDGDRSAGARFWFDLPLARTAAARPGA